MLEGVNRILAVTTDAQKMAVIGQIDAINKRIRTFKLELDKLMSPSKRGHTITSSDVDEEAEALDLRHELEAQLEDELKKREALNKIAIGDKKKFKGSDQAKDIEVEILVSDRLIAKTRETIDILKSVCRSTADAAQSNTRKKMEIVEKYREQSAQTDAKGHVFSQRQYFKPTDCGICCEPLWDTKNLGFECSGRPLRAYASLQANLPQGLPFASGYLVPEPKQVEEHSSHGNGLWPDM
ncbi:hypothetical protein HDV03_002910 [Kappamyces sp. JEL0829]|nr:hypothetical protein HDV03_002910 [Kappamyces sp. JEL0829]